MKRRLRPWLIYLSIAVFLWITGGFLFAYAMTCSATKNYPDIRTIDNFPAQQLSISTSDGLKINAWLAGTNKDRTVVLLCGIRGNSSMMVERAKIYLANGYSVLLPDLRATGRSEGNVISFGWNERHDLLACVRWLKANGYSGIGVHGCSLGAATITYSLDSVCDYSFMVVESPYDNIDHAFAHRTFDSGMNRALFWPVYFFTEERTGADPDELAPIQRVSKYKGPLLYLTGDQEKQIPLEEAKQIFSSFGSVNKTIRIFKGAGHFDFLAYDRPGYTASLNAFLQTLTRQP